MPEASVHEDHSLMTGQDDVGFSREILPMEEQMGGSEDRWRGSLENITEMASNLDSLQKLLLKKAVFVEEDTFSRASLVSEQARTIKVRLKND